MYSQKLIDFRLELFEQQNGWLPQRHTYGEIQEFTAYIESLVKKESNSKNTYLTLSKPLTEKRQQEIRRWIENEQAMCGMDYSYWSNNYAFVCDEKGQIFKFKNRNSQAVFDSVIADFEEKQVSIEIICLDPDTKVLTADLRWILIDDVKIGDELVAVDEGRTEEQSRNEGTIRRRQRRKGEYRTVPKHHTHRERKMRTAIVEEKWDTFQPAVKITFEDGREVISSPSHKWLCKKGKTVYPAWQETKKIAVGDSVRYVTRPWGESSYEDGWYGGFLDGEGCMSLPKDGGVDICIAQRFNAALERARKYLTDRGYTVRQDVDNRKGGESSKFGNEPVAKLFVSRMDELFRLLGQTRPSRFIGRRWWEGKSLPGKRSGIGWSKVISIEILPPRRLVDIQTSTGTFIAEGFVSHNCLKARQVGITTKVALYFIHRMLFISHTQAVMASVQKDKSDLIERILNTAYTHCPWWLVPRRMPKKSFDNGSILSIQSGMQATGIAQGWTPQLIHISEISLIPNPKETIEEGLLPATHSSRNLFMVFEGTGSGNVGWFPDFWRDSKKKWPLGESRMCPVFISWPLATDLYPQEDWLRKYPVPHDFIAKRIDETKKHVARCESYIRNTPYLSKVVGKDYRMPVEQQWYWQFEYRQAKERHTLQKFAARMPADDFEALTGVFDSVFDIEVTNRLEENVYNIITNEDTGVEIRERKKEVQAYAITGHSIPEKFHPKDEDIDWNKEAIRITWSNNRGEKYDWEMIPLLPYNEDVETETMDKLLVFIPPEEWNEYAEGIDTAHGLGKPDEERTSISVSKKGTGADFDEQCCEYTSNKLSPAQTVPFAACIAAWYGKCCRDPRGVKFAIEQVRGPGDTCQNQLKIMGFNYQHKPGRLDGSKVKDEAKHREGWYSNSVSVPILMGRFVEAIEGGWYKPHSKWLIEECKTLERHSKDSGKDAMEHKQGAFDDRVRAGAMSYITFHTYDDLAERSQRRYAVPQSKKTNKGVCRANTVTIGDGWE